VKLYACVNCGEKTYKKLKECSFCDSKEFEESECTEREVIFVVLKEISLHSEEYEEFSEDFLEEKVAKRIGEDFKYSNFLSTLGNAVKEGIFTKMIVYVSGA